MANAVKNEASVKLAEPTARVAPVLKQGALKWQHEGFVWREALVRLPDGATLQDINDTPSMWSNIQGAAPTALRQWDRLRIVSYDETWFCDATVSFADRTQVILCGIRKVDMPRRAVALFEDENYKIDWCGSGYGVVRKSDGIMLGGQTHQTPEGARQYLMQLYPTRLG